MATCAGNGWHAGTYNANKHLCNAFKVSDAYIQKLWGSIECYSRNHYHGQDSPSEIRGTNDEISIVNIDRRAYASSMKRQ